MSLREPRSTLRVKVLLLTDYLCFGYLPLHATVGVLWVTGNGAVVQIQHLDPLRGVIFCWHFGLLEYV